MATIAPLLPFSQPAQQSNSPAATGTGSDNAFSSILSDTVSSRDTASQITPQQRSTSRNAGLAASENRQNSADTPSDFKADELTADSGNTVDSAVATSKKILFLNFPDTAGILENLQLTASQTDQAHLSVTVPSNDRLPPVQHIEFAIVSEGTTQPIAISTETDIKLQQFSSQQSENHPARIINGPWSSAFQTETEDTYHTSKPTLVFNSDTAGIKVAQSQANSEPIISNQLQELIQANEKGTITISRQAANTASLNDLNFLKSTAQPSLTLTPETGSKIFEMAPLSQSTDIRSKIFDAVLQQSENINQESRQIPVGSSNKAETQPQPGPARAATMNSPVQAATLMQTTEYDNIQQIADTSLSPASTSAYARSNNAVTTTPLMNQPIPAAIFSVPGQSQADNPQYGKMENIMTGGKTTALNLSAVITLDTPDTILTGAEAPRNSQDTAMPASAELTQLRPLSTAITQTQSSSSEGPVAVAVSQLTTIRETTGKPSTERPTPTDLEPLRQDAQSQYLKGTIEARSRDNDSNNQNQQSNQQSNQQERTATLQAQATSQSVTTPTSEQGTSFSQISQGALTQSLPQSAVTVSQPVIVTPSSQMYEESVMNQVAERFQINNRNQETQINIKLHPVELGELKIELNMKDGNIRAHVIAQTGQVQQILEKNMPRLKEMLQDQGMQIEEILVSTKAENVGDFDLPGDQLSKRDNPSHQDRQNIDTTFKDTFEAIVTDEAPAFGVNVKA
jgi:flagellar hook-length control protein FliK